MKKLFCYFAFLFATIPALAQITPEEAIQALEEYVADSVNQLPQDLDGMILTKFDIKGNDFITYYVIDEEDTGIDFDIMVAGLRENKKFFVDVSNSDTEEFFGIIIASGLNYVSVFTGDKSGKSARIVITPEELIEFTQKGADSRDFIKMSILAARKEFPTDSGNGITIEQIYLEDNYMCYIYKTDGSVITIENLQVIKENGDEMERIIITSLKNNMDEDQQILYRKMVEAKIGMKIMYYSDDIAEAVSFTITPEYLKTELSPVL